jgi:hypothetical protein
MKLTSVDINSQPDGNDGSEKVSIIFQGIYSILGLAVGVFFLISGLLLLLSGIGGSSHFVATILGAKFDVADATAGLIFAVLGFFIVFTTKYEVRIRRNNRTSRRDILPKSETSKKSDREIAVNLLQRGIAFDIIATSTGLSIEEVQQLQQKLNESP